jgi:hypothetical protein
MASACADLADVPSVLLLRVPAAPETEPGQWRQRELVLAVVVLAEPQTFRLRIDQDKFNLLCLLSHANFTNAYFGEPQ